MSIDILSKIIIINKITMIVFNFLRLLIVLTKQTILLLSPLSKRNGLRSLHKDKNSIKNVFHNLVKLSLSTSNKNISFVSCSQLREKKNNWWFVIIWKKYTPPVVYIHYNCRNVLLILPAC